VLNKKRIKETTVYVFIVIITFLVLQSVVVVMHEFTHSTLAWLFGDMTSPRDIIWGNFFTMTGWDEGVHYHSLFPSANNMTEAIIGASPLLVHSVIVTFGLWFLQTGRMKAKKFLFHLLYWFTVANFMELIAYITMRSLAAGGDTGHLSRGLGLSPWMIFIVGNTIIIFGLYVLFKNVLPVKYDLFAKENVLTKWAILLITSFCLFLWGSGLRIILYIYPDPQWIFGMIGFAAFISVLFIFKPAR